MEFNDVPSTSSVFFVTGTMRSGTSLLSDLLYSRLTRTMRHPDIVFSMEGMPAFRHGLMLLRNGKSYRTASADPAWIPTFGRTVNLGSAKVAGEAAFASEMVRQLRARLSEITAKPVPPTSRFGVKYTGIRNEFLMLRRHYPNAKLIVMVRDPRDVVSSHKFRTLKQPLTRNLSIVHDILNMSRFAAHHAADPSVLIVRYEDLIADQHVEMDRIMTFLGVDPQAYDWPSLDKGVLNNSSFGDTYQGGKIQIASGVAKSRSRYKQFLSSSEVQLVETLTEPVMRRHGYVTEPHGELTLPKASLLATYLPLVVRSGLSINDSLAALRAVAEEQDFDDLLNAVLVDIANESPPVAPVADLAAD